jgi:predicted SnoaL-like aldol condensation-catalyzing enzyme
MKRVVFASLALASLLSGCATMSSSVPTSIDPNDPSVKSNPKIAIALGYLDTVWTQGKPIEGYNKYVNLAVYKHHPDKVGTTNPAGLQAFRDKFPNFKYTVGQVFIQGDYVITHSIVTGVPGIGTEVKSSQPGVPAKPKVGDEVIDIFLIKDGKIVEQWDTVEPIGGSADGII